MQRDTETHRYTHTEIERQTDTQKETQADTDTHTQIKYISVRVCRVKTTHTVRSH